MTDTSPEAVERIWVWWNEPHTARVVSGPGEPHPERATAFVRADIHEAALTEARAETAAVIEVAEAWCEAVGRDSSWDSWDHHYKRMRWEIIPAVEQNVTAALDEIKRQAREDDPLRKEVRDLLDLIDIQKRHITPAPEKENQDEANSRDERDQVFGDQIMRILALLDQAPEDRQ